VRSHPQRRETVHCLLFLLDHRHQKKPGLPHFKNTSHLLRLPGFKHQKMNLSVLQSLCCRRTSARITPSAQQENVLYALVQRVLSTMFLQQANGSLSLQIVIDNQSIY
jgi:hypothetical protein